MTQAINEQKEAHYSSQMKFKVESTDASFTGSYTVYFLTVFSPLLEMVYCCVLTLPHPLRKTHPARWVQTRGQSCSMGKSGLCQNIQKGCSCCPQALCMTCGTAPCSQPRFCALDGMKICQCYPNQDPHPPGVEQRESRGREPFCEE